jgi:hypothetical protein
MELDSSFLFLLEQIKDIGMSCSASLRSLHSLLTFIFLSLSPPHFPREEKWDVCLLTRSVYLSLSCAGLHRPRWRPVCGEILFHNWELNLSLAGHWLSSAGRDGAWEVRMGSGQMQMCCDIFAASWLWRGCLLTTGHLSSRHPVVVGAEDVSLGSLLLVWRKRGRAPGAVLPSECGFSAV